MFKIGDFSKLTRVSIRMLRYYDEIGIFKPAKIDDFTGYRYYSATQIKTINLIVSLRDMGFNVAEISEVIKENTDERLAKKLKDKKGQVEGSISKEKEKLEKLNAAINNLKKEGVNMSYNVKTKSVPSYKVISLRDIIPSYENEGVLWERLSGYMSEKKIKMGTVCFATYYDEEYKESDVDVEVAISVDKLLENEKEFVYKETDPIDKVVSILVPGDYSNIAPAFEYMGKWIEENGYSICGNARQYEIKGPWDEKDPKNYLTEIQMPVFKM